MNLALLNALVLTGGNWVIYGLLLCSVLAMAVILERAIVLRREDDGLEKLRREFPRALSGDLDSMGKALHAHQDAAVGRILRAGFAQAQHGVAGVEDHLIAASLAEKNLLERRLLFLGTLGNNAPFIGLFGTVLGVIKAFHDLSNSGAGPEVVMQGLSEALIATAVGLFVAIPCVVGYNHFQKKVKDILTGTESLGRLLLAQVRTAKAHK